MVTTIFQRLLAFFTYKLNATRRKILAVGNCINQDTNSDYEYYQHKDIDSIRIEYTSLIPV